MFGRTLGVMLVTHHIPTYQHTHTGQLQATAALFLPYYAYQDLAGNLGTQDADLLVYVGPPSYIDNDLGEVGVNSPHTQHCHL
jgi:hypothetical protein